MLPLLRRQELTFAILVLDLDRFKAVYDSLGHAIDDALLKEVAKRLKANTRDVDVVARLGGDEFAIFQRGDVDTKIGAGVLALIVASAAVTGYDFLAPIVSGVGVSSLAVREPSWAWLLILISVTALFQFLRNLADKRHVDELAGASAADERA